MKKIFGHICCALAACLVLSTGGCGEGAFQADLADVPVYPEAGAFSFLLRTWDLRRQIPVQGNLQIIPII